MALRIGIDIRAACGPKTGDRTYLMGLLEGLAQLQPEHEILLYSDRAPEPGVGRLPFGVRVIPCRPARLFTPRVLPQAARADGVDVLHVQYIPPRCRAPRVLTTIHDVTYRLFPEWFPWKDRLLLHHGIRRALGSVAGVITGSECTRQDLRMVYGIDDGSIHVTPYAVSDGLARPSEGEIESVRRRHGLSRPYALYVGVLQPRKNVPRMVEGFLRAKREASFPHEFVLVGKKGWKSAGCMASLSTPEAQRHTRWLGYVPDADLPALFAGADLFVFPTLYEGFGLPVLEAFRCGTPVVTSNVSALPEVAGDAAVLVDPSSAAAIASAIARVLMDEVERERLRQAGLLRADAFSWRRTAELTVRAYEEVAGR